MHGPVTQRWAGVLLGLVAAIHATAARPASDSLAIVVAADRKGESVTADTVSLVFLRKKQRWSDGRRAQPVNLPADEPIRRQFSEAVFHLQPAALEDYWNEQYFHGIQPPHVVQSERAMARFVAGTDGAIGYLRYCDLPPDLKVLLVITPDGRLTDPAVAAPACRATAE